MYIHVHEAWALGLENDALAPVKAHHDMHRG